jgi:hypothetical protein
MHIEAFGPVLVVPVGQSMQPRFVVLLGTGDTNCPLGQSSQDMHEVAPSAVLKPLWLAQSVQLGALTVLLKKPAAHSSQPPGRTCHPRLQPQTLS